MLSVPAIFYRPKDRQQEADFQRNKLMVTESDHLTLYNIYKQWENSNYSSKWCKKRFIHFKSLKKVQEVKKQISEILDQLGIEMSSSGNNMDVVRKAICSGYFINAARIKSIGEYFNLRNGLPCQVHPSSALFSLGYSPDYVVYHQVIFTSKEYLHCVTTVNPFWLAELGPRFFQIKQSEEENGEMVIKDIKPLKLFEDEVE